VSRRPLANVVIVHHELKEWASYFSALWDRSRHHEVRADDRRVPYAPGHTVKLSEYTPQGAPTGRWVRGAITHVTRGGVGSNVVIPAGVCVFTFAEYSRAGSDANDTSITPHGRGHA